MRRALALVLVVLALGALAATGRARLEAQGEPEVRAGLLYLPKGPYLRMLSLGHEETLADLLYLWAIQYYGNYDDHSRYRYLVAVFDGAITELDPRFRDPYLIGSLIMSIEAQERHLALDLLDKGLRHRPDDWELAYFAGWEAAGLGDYRRAREYFRRASKMPGALPVYERLATRMLARAGDREGALAEYRAMFAEARDEKTREVAARWIARLETEITLQAVRDGLTRFVAREGRCPARLDVLLRTGDLDRVPPGLAALRFDPQACRVLPPPGSSIGQPG